MDKACISPCLYHKTSPRWKFSHYQYHANSQWWCPMLILMIWIRKHNLVCLMMRIEESCRLGSLACGLMSRYGVTVKSPALRHNEVCRQPCLGLRTQISRHLLLQSALLLPNKYCSYISCLAIQAPSVVEGRCTPHPVIAPTQCVVF